MKNKLKRLQLTIRNFDKKSTIFGAVFALTLLSLSILIPKISTHADPGDPQVILEADARIADPVAGATPDMNIIATDNDKYSVSIAYWYLHEGSNPSLTTESVFEEHKDYSLRFVFEAKEGYTFRDDTAFTINGQSTLRYGTNAQREYTFQDVSAHAGETIFDITYDLNGGTVGGEGTFTNHSVSFGMELTYDALITHFGVEAPAGKVLNYVTINDVPFNIGDGYFLNENIVIKYFWRDDTSETYSIDFDINGGTAVNYDVPAEVPAGQAFVLNAPDTDQVLPPENQEFDAFEVNGERVEAGTTITINQDSTFKLLWKNIDSIPATTYHTFFEKTESATEELAWDADLTDYINNKRIEWQNSPTGQGVDEEYRNDWEALYVMEDGIYKYPIYLITYFTGTTVSDTCNNTILVGDPNDLTNLGCVIYNYRVEYREVTVTKPTHFTVEYNDGGVLRAGDKLVSQTVPAGEWAPEPENAAGEKLTEILTEVDGKYYYNDYELIDVYIDPEFATPFEGGPITENTTVYLKWRDTLEDYEQISEVNLTITPPEPGTEITMEEDDWNSQAPQLDIVLPEGIQYELWTDSEDENYAYWVEEGAFGSDPFVGVIEKGGKYYAEVWLRTNVPDVIFARDVAVKANGVALSADLISYDIDSLVVLVEVDIEDDEPIATGSPETGTSTNEGNSVTIAASGTAITAIALTGLIVVFYIRQKSSE